MKTKVIKTWKRELSILLIGYLVYLTQTNNTQALELWMLPVFVFTSGAYGLESYKQLTVSKRTGDV